jgi:hypothetical protein
MNITSIFGALSTSFLGLRSSWPSRPACPAYSTFGKLPQATGAQAFRPVYDDFTQRTTVAASSSLLLSNA